METDLTEEQIDIVGRMVQFRYYKSMNELRKMIKSYFISHGWQDSLKKFKLKQQSDGTVSMYSNPKFLKNSG